MTKAEALDAEILSVIDAWHRDGETLDEEAFNDLALRIFAYQLENNPRYAAYCERLGVTMERFPSSWEAIPAVPAAAFKDAAITTFDPQRAALTFETSGTTAGTGGLHYMETPALYDAALLAGFDRCMLSDGARLRYFNLVPNPAEAPRSSLGYMMRRVATERGASDTGWYLRNGELLVDDLVDGLREAVAQNQPVCIAATAFALVHLLDAMAERDITLALPAASRVMETGGFKGRSRSVSREELYRRVHEAFGVPLAAIVAEYGMTELTSQYYDAIPSRNELDPRTKSGPPWLRARIVGLDRAGVPAGVVGAITHVDLANRSSCVAIATEDLGVRFEDGFVLLGRAIDAPPRGCSLSAEDLRRVAT